MKFFRKIQSRIGLLILMGLVSNVTFSCYSAFRTKNNIKKKTEPEEYISLEKYKLKDVIIHLVENSIDSQTIPELSDGLIQCYRRLVSGYHTVSSRDLTNAMPEILKWVCEEHENHIKADRASRPDASGNNVVSCGNNCNLTQVLSLLAQIKSRIGTVADPVCCDTILGILGNACECLGEGNSISCVLAELLDCCRGTFTIFDGLEELICDKFEQTWTILDTNFNGTFTKLDFICEKIENVQETIDEDFIILLEEILETQDIICDKFEQTWTILADLNLDNSGVFTSISDLKETLTECCADLEKDFQETWTILDFICEKIEIGFSGTFTAIGDLKEVTCDKFEQTWTILANLNLDRTSIFTSISDLKETITECCADLEKDFQETWTILESFEEITCDKFEQTWTILNGLKIDINNITATAATDISGVFTAIADLKETLTECCEELKEDFRETWTILNSIENAIENIEVDVNVTATDLNITLTTLDRILEKVCHIEDTVCPILIGQEDIPYFITEPGCYCLKETVTFGQPFILDVQPPGGVRFTSTAIAIQNTSNVVLDLNSKAIIGTFTGTQLGEIGENITFNVDLGILIDGSQNITVRDGFIKHTFVGMASLNSASLTLDNIVITTAILGFAGYASYDGLIQNCKVSNLIDLGITPAGLIFDSIPEPEFSLFPNVNPLPGCKQWVVQDNIVSGMAGNGAEADGSGSGFINRDSDGFCYKRNKALNLVNGSSGENGGFSIQSSSIVSIVDCLSEENGKGFEIEQSRNVSLINCQALASINEGFDILSSSTIITLENCLAQDSGQGGGVIPGFTIDTSGNVLIQNSESRGNSGDGFFLDSSDFCVLKSNVAYGNVGIGVNNSGSVLNDFYNNLSIFNGGGNYSGVSLVVAPTSSTGYWANILP